MNAHDKKIYAQGKKDALKRGKREEYLKIEEYEGAYKKGQIKFAEEVLKEYKHLKRKNNLNDWVKDFISEDDEVPSDCFKALNYGAYIASCYFDNHLEWLEQRIKELRK
jgi:hypothetical protein